MISYDQALLRDNTKEVCALTQASWKELEQQVPYDPDWDLLLKLEDMGCLKLYRQRHLEVTVGIAVVILTPSTHNKGCKVGMVETIYVRPHNRGKGQEFLDYIEKDLVASGVSYVVLGLPPRYGDNPAFVAKRGYMKTDNLFMKQLV